MASKKQVLSLFLALALSVSLFAGCGGGEGSGSPQAASPVPDAGGAPSASAAAPSGGGEAEGVSGSITWWTWSTEATDVYNAQVEAFKKDNPAADIKLEFIANAEYWKKLPIAIAGGTGPDLYQMTRPSFELYAASKQAADLTEAVAASQALQQNLAAMDPVLVDCYQFEGKQMALPYTVESTAIVYNKTLFEAAGLPEPKTVEDTWTWEDLREMANQLTKRAETVDQSQYGFMCDTDKIPGWEMIYSHGGTLFNDAGDACTLGSDIAIEALRPLVEMATVDKVSPTTDATSAMSADDLFMTGKIAIMAAGVWKLPTYQKITGFEWDCAQLPLDSKTGKRVSSSNVLGYVVNPNTKGMGLCTAVLESFTSAASQKLFADMHVYIPANESVRDSYFDATVPANVAAYQKALGYVRPNIFSQYIPYAQFKELYSNGLKDAINNGRDIGEVMREQEAAINAIMEENKGAF